VGKESLAIHIPSQSFSATIENSSKAIKAFLQQHPEAALVLEATGGYEANLIALAIQNGHAVYRVNARRVRAYMESIGVQAKTDAIDAKGLANYAVANAARLLRFELPSDEQQELQQLVRRREELLSMHVQEQNRMQCPNNKRLKASISAVLKALEKQLSSIDKQIGELIKDSPEMSKKLDIMTAFKGVGRVTAVALLSMLPELGLLSGKQIAALAGLAPIAKDSGKYSGYRRVKGGRVAVRKALFMVALSASRYNAEIKIFYDRLIKNGKKPMQALIAVARKILVILNAKLRDAMAAG
jgi:transposase